MSPDPVEVLILAMGFAAGYGVREWVSRRRHRLYRESHWMFDVILSPAEMKDTYAKAPEPQPPEDVHDGFSRAGPRRVFRYKGGGARV
jgi:hypothetical protein